MDRGETRVAILEAEGTPELRLSKAGRRKPVAQSAARSPRRKRPHWSVGRAVHRAAGSPLDRRQHLQGQRRQRPARPRGGVRRHRPREERLPARRRHRDAGRRGRAARAHELEGQADLRVLKPGQEIIVQVVKDPLKTKGARLSMQLSIAGRYLVYVPDGEGVGVSRRLERQGARPAAQAGQGPRPRQGRGAIIRTAAQGAKREDFEREIKYLHKLYEVLQKRVGGDRRAGDGLPGGRPAGARHPRHLLRAVRARDRRRREGAPAPDSFFTRTAPELLDRLELYKDDKKPLFEKYGIDEVMHVDAQPRVDLPSGGYLMIDYAEAMTVIDVNSGSFTGRGKGARLEDTITQDESRGGRGGRRASCGCATSAGSSSSTSSTWRVRATATPC